MSKQSKPTPGQIAAKVIVEHLSDPQAEEKEAKAQAEKEERQREALRKLGLLGGKSKTPDRSGK